MIIMTNIPIHWCMHLATLRWREKLPKTMLV